MTLIVTVDTLLYWLDKIKPSERSLVGDRAFYLSQQAQAGRAVIPGLAIAAPALRQFLATNNWSEPLMRQLLTSTLHINVDNAQQLKGLALHIREELCQAELPEVWVNTLEIAVGQLNAPVLMFSPCLVKRVASREAGSIASSHKIAQISGLLESRVCRNNRDSLTLAWKETWAELFSARSLFYWQKSGICLQDLDLAILVQPVWNAIAAGSLETRGDIWEIKATWGLGMSIPAGKTIPDYYQVNSLTGEVEQQILGNKLIAYHVPVPQEQTGKTDVFMAMNLDFCQFIEPLILNEKLQEQLALPEPFLSDLIQLTKTLISPLGERLFLAWMICPTETSEGQNAVNFEHLANLNEPKFSNCQLYLSDLIYLNSGQQQNQNNLNNATDAGDYLVNFLADVNENHPWLVGVGASPGEAIASAFVISDNGIPTNIPPKNIIVIKTINVDALFCLKEAAGVIAEQGGMTSHAAILARELGIPAVVGVIGATQKIKSGQILLINGERGKIFQANSPIEVSQTVHKYPQEAPVFLRHKPNTMPIISEAKSVFELTGTQVMVNLSQVKSLENLENLPVDGVGLLRSELMILDLVGRPNPQNWIAGHQEEFINLMTEAVTKIARYFFPRPVFYRSCDLHADADAQAEKNPVLGVHGAFSYLLDSSLFELELTVLERVQTDGYTNINLILPFVRTVEEFVFCRQKVTQNGLDRVNDFQLWIMAEVPSILFLLEDYIKAGVQGIAIGTNDLTQLLLGVDRNHPQFQHIFENPHGAVKEAIRQLVSLAKSFNIPCSICGQAVVMDPEFIDDLVHWGVTVISVEPISFETTCRAIARSEKRLLLEAARRQLYS